MVNNELVRLVNECLNGRENQINFHGFSEFEEDFNDYIYNNEDNVMSVKGVLLKNMYLPIHGVWHASYSLINLNGNPFKNSLEIPLDIIDKLRKDKDPERLELFFYHLGDKKFDVYISNYIQSEFVEQEPFEETDCDSSLN